MWGAQESKVARYLELYGEATAVQAGKALNMRVHVVQYILERLTSSGALKRRVLVDTHRLGLQRLAVFVSMLGMSESAYEKLLQTLKRSSSVALLLELSGLYQLEINLVGKNIAHLRQQLDLLSKSISSVSASRATALQIEHQIYGTKVLGSLQPKSSAHPLSRASIGYHANVETLPIDALDHKILKRLMSTERVSLRTLAQQLSIPASTCEYRVRKLEDQKIIAGYTYLLEGFSLLHYVVLVHMKLVNTELRNQLKKFCVKHSAVFYLVENIGSWDFELGLVVRQPSEVTRLLHDLHSVLGEEISRSDVISLLGRTKVTDYPFSELSEWQA